MLDTVLVVLRSGGVYDARYVQRMRNMVHRHTRADYRFKCLTDISVPGVECIPLEHDWPGWWAKVEMWRPDLEDEFGRTLYVDLDTVICGPLDPLIEQEAPCITKDFYHGVPSQSVLLYEPGQFRPLWDEFTRDPEGWMQAGDQFIAPHFGDQILMTKVNKAPLRYWQDVAPGRVKSFKADFVFTRPDPDQVSVVCFHGNPKPHQLGGWVQDEWV